ncbi:RES family NAD+ phosphorylase [Georgenia yuyongxinii]
MTRARRHLPEPTDITGFPRRTVPAGETVYRSHGERNADGTPRSPWWFASAPADPDNGGRFDLPTPNGTCYVAFDPTTALRERFGEELMELGVLSGEDVDATAVSRLTLQDDVAAADTGDERAANWITRELIAIDGYALTQRWAAAFARDGHEGVLYESRFTTVTETPPPAPFGPAGGRDWPVDGTEDVRAVLGKAGIKVANPPRRTFTKAFRPDHR